MLRKSLFWIHLVIGITVGLVVFMMSATGVVLMYERQLRTWVAESHYVPATEQGQALALEQLLVQAKLSKPELAINSVVLTNDPGAPIELRAGRRGGLALNPYTGAAMATDSPRLEKVMSMAEGLHRWFNVQGEGRDSARQITRISNVAFLFLVLSGLYLWLPALLKWVQFKARLLFRKEYPSSKARDYHWHHIFGIWAAIPLLAVVYSGMVISYPWAANLMYRAFGAEVPAAQQGAGREGGGERGVDRGADRNAERSREGGANSERQQTQGSVPVAVELPLADLVSKAIEHSAGNWNRLTLTLPRDDSAPVQIEVDQGNGAQAHKRYTLSLARSTGEILNTRTFADTPEAQRLRGIARFLHTGEVLGFWGQTIAGLASFAALFMVWTGFALSYRRLIQPLFKHNS